MENLLAFRWLFRYDEENYGPMQALNTHIDNRCVVQGGESMVRKVLFGALIALLVGIVSSVVFATSNEPAITDIFVTNDDRALLLSARVKGGFTPEVLEAIESGVPTTFIYYLKLHQKKSFWFDEEVVAREIQHQVKYDPLKKEFYFVQANGVVRNNRTTKDLAEVRRWMSMLLAEPIVPVYLLQIGAEYYVKMKVEIKTVEFSFPLKPLFFFLSFGQRSTNWVESAPFLFGNETWSSRK